MSSVWCFWEDVADLLIFSHSWILFQDITWQDEHSAPFSWETKVNKQIFLVLYFNIGLSFYTFPSSFIVFILVLDRLMSPLFYASRKSDHAASQIGLVCFDLHQEKHRTYFMNKSFLVLSADIQIICFFVANFLINLPCLVRPLSLIPYKQSCISLLKSGIK